MGSVSAIASIERIERGDFEKFRGLIRDSCGISLGDTKDALLTSRLGRRMRELGLRDHSAYYELVVADTSGAELQCLVDAVSTNVTSFFREPEHFDILAEHLAQVAAQRQEIRLWSAACSSGEEPYSMAMTVLDALPEAASSVRILATDISTSALRRAARAVYPAEKLGKLPKRYALQFFAPQEDGGSQLSPTVRRMIALSPINLSKPPFPMKGPFEVVFCRNVMIYFDIATRHRLILEIERLLAPGGLLMLGHAESLAGIPCSLKPVAASVYRKAL